MIRINGFKQTPQRIDVPEWPETKRINTRSFRAHCNAFFARYGMSICDYADGIKSHERAVQRRMSAKTT